MRPRQQWLPPSECCLKKCFVIVSPDLLQNYYNQHATWPTTTMCTLLPSYRDAEKSAAAVLKKASEARDLINQVTAAAASALQEVEGLKQQEKVEAAAVTEARGALKKLEMAGRAR